MKRCKGYGPDFDTVLRYGKRKYRNLGYFTMFLGTVPHVCWSVLPYNDIEPNDLVIPYVFRNGRWQRVSAQAGEEWQQWIADVYHCSQCWGQKMTDEEMLIDLVETQLQKDPDDYSPAPSLFMECAAYWNSLCDAYPY